MPASRTAEVWTMADHFVVAAPSTADTDRLVDATCSTRCPTPRGSSTSRAQPGRLGCTRRGTARRTDRRCVLDVTDPEPLPDDHPLWTFGNVVITPHIANTRTGLNATLAPTVRETSLVSSRGEQLIAVVDPGAGTDPRRSTAPSPPPAGSHPEQCAKRFGQWSRIAHRVSARSLHRTCTRSGVAGVVGGWVRACRATSSTALPRPSRATWRTGRRWP